MAIGTGAEATEERGGGASGTERAGRGYERAGLAGALAAGGPAPVAAARAKGGGTAARDKRGPAGRLADGTPGEIARNRSKRVRLAAAVDGAAGAKGSAKGGSAKKKPHVLLEIPKGNRMHCLLCAANEKGTLKTRFACVGCDKGYHVNCFAAFHHADSVQDNPQVAQAVERADVYAMSSARVKRSKHMPNMADLVLWKGD